AGVSQKRPTIQLPRASASILFHSSALSWSFAAAMFSSRCASEDVPGIGNMTGDFCSNQASASCTTLTLRRFASASNALTSPFQIAAVYGLRNEPDKMFEWLDRAYAERDSGLTQLLVTRFILNHKNDPRF